jgi:DNA-directed RNA polymerase specialized sigma24 family protein
MSLSQETDESLMMRFGRGDAAAFEFLYRRHEMKVFRYLRRNIRSEAGANDLMQEVWFAVVRGAAN